MKAKKISIFIISCTCLLAYLTFALTVSINIKDKLILGNLPVSIVYRDTCSANQFDSHIIALKKLNIPVFSQTSIPNQIINQLLLPLTA